MRISSLKPRESIAKSAATENEKLKCPVRLRNWRPQNDTQFHPTFASSEPRTPAHSQPLPGRKLRSSSGFMVTVTSLDIDSSSEYLLAWFRLSCGFDFASPHPVSSETREIIQHHERDKEDHHFENSATANGGE